MKRLAAFSIMVSLLAITPRLYATSTQLDPGPVWYQTVALSGDPAPGTAGDTVFFAFENPVLNDAGQTAFHARFNGSTITRDNDRAIYTADAAGGLRLVARENDPYPAALQLPTDDFDLHIEVLSDQPILSETGRVLFGARLGGRFLDNADDQVLMRDTAGSLEQVMRTGSQVPGLSNGVLLDEIGIVRIDRDGGVVSMSRLTGAGITATNNSVILAERGGFQILAQESGVAPGTIEPAVFQDMATNFAIESNSLGRVAFDAFLSVPGSGNLDPYAVYNETAEGLRLVARSGMPAPGRPAGTRIEGPVFAKTNDAGQTAFLTGLLGGVTLGFDSALYLDTDGVLEIIALEDADSPDGIDDTRFSRFRSLELNNAGQAAFLAELTGNGTQTTSQKIIYRYDPEQGLESIAMQTDEAPGTPEGVRLGTIVPPLLNDAGQVAFFSRLYGDGVDATNREALFATDPDGTLRLVVRTGELFDVDPDPSAEDLRTISALIDVNTFGSSAIASKTMRPGAFNNAGQLAFVLEFTDGSSGVFVATVPEPATLSFVCLGGLLFVRRRR